MLSLPSISNVYGVVQVTVNYTSNTEMVRALLAAETVTIAATDITIDTATTTATEVSAANATSNSETRNEKENLS